MEAPPVSVVVQTQIGEPTAHAVLPSAAPEEPTKSKSGAVYAAIKAEFLVTVSQDKPKKSQQDAEKHQPPSKNDRKRARKEQRANDVCKFILSEEVCPYGDKCRISHDLQAYLQAKTLPDLPGPCPLFEKYGLCPYSVKCRYASSHMAQTGDPPRVTNARREPVQPRPPPLNSLPKTLQAKLWKGAREFPRAEAVIAEWNALQKVRQATRGGQSARPSALTNAPPAPSVTTPLPDAPAAAAAPLQSDILCPTTACLPELLPESDVAAIRLHSRERRPIQFRDRLYLAPLTTIGNLPFRVLLKQFGVDMTCGEMAMASNLLNGHKSEWALLKRHPSEDCFGIQLAASHVDQMARCAELLADEARFEFLDLNCGCPIDLVYNKGMGSALLERPARLEDLVRAAHRVAPQPITVKLRIGRDEKNPSIHRNILPYMHEWGVSTTVVHGRSREQRYNREANWDYIKQCVQVAKIPVVGNGDVYSQQEYWSRVEETGVASVMLARGAIIKPWLPTEIKERRDWDISASERLDIIRQYCHLGLDHWGSDEQGVENTRQFLLNWLSFLHRYIPIGMLERLPSKINHRPRPFVGRSDLETLLASPEVGDWVKISEMFLGPVRSGFHFVPKHKSPAWEKDENNKDPVPEG